jgi:hypothetical protein
MHVIGHQHISVDGNFVEFGGGAQPFQIVLVVFRIEKDVLVVIAALEDVVRLVGNDEAGESGHDRTGNWNRKTPILALCP